MARDRTKTLSGWILSAVPARAVSLLAPFLVIPFAIDSIGPEAYGLWATALTIGAFSAFADLGSGNGLLTLVTESESSGSTEGSRALVSSAFALTSAISALLAVAAVPALFAFSTSTWLEGQPLPQQEGVGIVAVCVFAFILGIPLTLIQRIQYATRQVTTANVWLAVGALLSALGFIGARWMGFSTVAAISVSVLAPVLVAAINSLVYFGFMRPDLRPSIRFVNAESMGRLSRSGGMFLLIGVCMTAGMSLDLVIASTRVGLSAGAEYSIASRLLGILFSFYVLVVMPFWPAAGAALAGRDIVWVRRTTRRLMVLGAGMLGLIGLLVSTVFRPLLVGWLGDASVAPASLLLLAVAAWNASLAAVSPPFMVQNAAAVLWPQALGWGLFAIVSMALKLALVDQYGVIALPVVSLAVWAIALAPAALAGYKVVLGRFGRGDESAEFSAKADLRRLHRAG